MCVYIIAHDYMGTHVKCFSSLLYTKISLLIYYKRNLTVNNRDIWEDRCNHSSHSLLLKVYPPLFLYICIHSTSFFFLILSRFDFSFYFLVVSFIPLLLTSCSLDMLLSHCGNWNNTVSTSRCFQYTQFQYKLVTYNQP